MAGDAGLVGEASHRDRLQLTLRRVHAFILVAMALATIGPVLGDWSGTAATAHVVVAVVEVVVAVDIWVAGERPRQVLVLLVLVAVSSSLPFRAYSGDIAAGLCLAALLLSAGRALAGRIAIAALVTGVAVQGASGLVWGYQVGINELGTLLLTSSNVVAALAFVASLERSTTRLDEAEASARHEQARLLERDERLHAMEVARQCLHDDVRASLISVTRGDPGADAHCAAAVRAVAEVARAPAGEASYGGPQRLDDIVADAVTSAPVAVEVDGTLGPASPQVSGPVAQALARALGECLRNVHRHAGVDRARIELRPDGPAVAVIVSDDGGGMAPAAEPGFGLTRSIRAPIHEAGGSVEITSSPAGTSIRLRVPVERAHEQAGEAVDPVARTYRLTLLAGGQRRLAWMTMLPLMVTWVVLGGWIVVREPGRAVLGAALLLAITALGAGVAHRIATRPPTTRWVAGLLVALTVLHGAGLMSLPDGGLLDYRSWAIGYLATLLIVVCFVVPARWSGALIGTQALLLLVTVAIRPGLSAGQVPIGSLNAWLASPLLTSLLGSGLRRNARRVEAELARARRAARELLRRQLADEITSVHLEHTRTVVVPWLTRVAEGRLSLDAAETRDQARTLLQETGDDLTVPGFYDRRLRAEVSRFRQQGGVVDIRAGFAPGASDRPTGQVLSRLVRGLRGAFRVTVSPPASADHATARVVVVPAPERFPDDLAQPAERERLGVTEVARDEFAVVLEVLEPSPEAIP